MKFNSKTTGVTIFIVTIITIAFIFLNPLDEEVSGEQYVSELREKLPDRTFRLGKQKKSGEYIMVSMDSIFRFRENTYLRYSDGRGVKFSREDQYDPDEIVRVILEVPYGLLEIDTKNTALNVNLISGTFREVRDESYLIDKDTRRYVHIPVWYRKVSDHVCDYAQENFLNRDSMRFEHKGLAVERMFHESHNGLSVITTMLEEDINSEKACDSLENRLRESARYHSSFSFGENGSNGYCYIEATLKETTVIDTTRLSYMIKDNTLPGAYFWGTNKNVLVRKRGDEYPFPLLVFHEGTWKKPKEVSFSFLETNLGVLVLLHPEHLGLSEREVEKIVRKRVKKGDPSVWIHEDRWTITPHLKNNVLPDIREKYMRKPNGIEVDGIYEPSLRYH